MLLIEITDEKFLAIDFEDLYIRFELMLRMLAFLESLSAGVSMSRESDISLLREYLYLNLFCSPGSFIF